MKKKMTDQEIIDYLYTDRDFLYRGKVAAFIPWCNAVGYEGHFQEYDTRKEAAEAKVFDGKSIIDIWDEVYPQIS